MVAWAFAIARRLHVDERRRAARRLTITEHEDAVPTCTLGPDELIEAQRTAREVHDMIAQLPENQRLAFELVKWEGLSLAEAAEALGTTVPAVKALTHRAYRALQDGLRGATSSASRSRCATDRMRCEWPGSSVVQPRRVDVEWS